MAGFIRAIHVFYKTNVDGRDKPGHDEYGTRSLSFTVTLTSASAPSDWRGRSCQR